MRKGRSSRTSRVASGYALIVRGTDGQPRAERFTDVHAYRLRLARLEVLEEEGVSINEIITLLDS